MWQYSNSLWEFELKFAKKISLSKIQKIKSSTTRTRMEFFQMGFQIDSISRVLRVTSMTRKPPIKNWSFFTWQKIYQKSHLISKTMKKGFENLNRIEFTKNILIKKGQIVHFALHSDRDGIYFSKLRQRMDILLNEYSCVDFRHITK